jgi:putative NADH-flavin reductase
VFNNRVTDIPQRRYEMKICILGATGGTGRALVKEALTLNHDISVFARKPADLDLFKDRIKIHQGDVLDQDALNNVIKGQDAVLSALGVRGTLLTGRRKISLYSRSIQNIIDAMQKHEVERFIGVTMSGAEVLPGQPKIMPLFRFLLKGYMDDILRMEARLDQTRLDWTIIRPANLTDSEKKGVYRTWTDRYPHDVFKISRTDVAGFMLNCLEDRTTIRKKIGIAY